MSSLLSNEEKLDEIYRILKKEESRTRWRFFSRVLRYGILFGLLLGIVTNPTFFVTKISNILTPIILENVKTALENQKNGVMETFKNLIPTNKEE
jgi:hypothetical protein